MTPPSVQIVGKNVLVVLGLKVPFFRNLFKVLYVRKVRFWDIPGRTRIDVESRHAVIFSFHKKF